MGSCGSGSKSGAKGGKVDVAGVSQGKQRTFEEAISGGSLFKPVTNPDYLTDLKARINCQTAVVAQEARIRGYDVEALPKITNEQGELARNPQIAWIDPQTGQNPQRPVRMGAKNAKQALETMENTVKSGERYTVGVVWKGARSGHIMSLDRDQKGQLRIYDPQSGQTYTGHNQIAGILKQTQYNRNGVDYSPRLMRIDNLNFNTSVVDKILKGARK